MNMGRIKNWSKFQHYKDRSPPWIKLHRELLDSMDYALLSPLAAKCLPLIWLVSSERDGLLPDRDRLAFRLRLSAEQAEQVATELKERGFLIDADANDDAEPAPQRSNPSRHIPDRIKSAVIARDGGACVWCNSKENIEFDHITPVSKGGAPVFENVQLLCRSCNRKKRSKDSEQAEQLATQILSSRSLEGEGEGETEREAEVEGANPTARAKAPSEKPQRAAPRTRMPDDFAISPRVAAWAAAKGHARMPERLEHFRSCAVAKGYVYADWDEAFMQSVRNDWAKFGASTTTPSRPRKML